MGTSPTTVPKVDIDRLRARLADLNRFGADPDTPGVNRVSFSEADMAARRMLISEMEMLGLAARMDPAGNVIGRWETGSGAAVLVGSHLDSVPRGGTLDGVLGVVAALECVETLIESGSEPSSPIEVIATSEEEGRFGGMLGSQAMVGAVDPAWFSNAVDDAGMPLTDAMRGAGLDPDAVASAARAPSDIAAFIELHIEQGPVLDRSGRSVGIVEGISGCFNWAVTLLGESNHAGTTPMELRRDSFRGLVDFAAQIPAIIDEIGSPQARLTVGKVDLAPNYPHTVPGRTDFVLIGRDLDLSAMEALARACRERIAIAAAGHGLTVEIHEASWLPPTLCDKAVIDVFKRQAAAMNIDAPLMPSGAGHDTQTFAGFTRAGMIFVPSSGGVSHAPEEHTDWDDVEIGCNLLLRTLLAIADEAAG